MTKNSIDINEMTIKKFIEANRPKEEQVRAQLDLGYSYNDKEIVLFEIRPFWDDPNTKDQILFAKIKRIKTKKKWSLYWMRASGKWESYKPFPESSHLDEILQKIKKDEYACFFG